MQHQGGPGSRTTGTRQQDASLAAAIAAEDLVKVEQLLRPREEVDKLIRHRGRERTALHLACRAGRAGVVRLLLVAQADVNLQASNGCSPLYFASQNGHHEVVELLVSAQADVDLQEEDGCSPLYIASQEGHRRVAERLIRAQADVNIQEDGGFSPLSIATQNGHVGIVNLLIKAGADVNIRDNDGTTPLHVASQGGHQRLMSTLLKAQADVDAQQIHGMSPLYISAQQGHLRLVRSLIAAQADVNLQRENGMSPLYVAAQQGHLLVARALVSAKADVHLRKHSGESPLYIAAQNNQQKVVDFLIQARADVDLQTLEGTSPLYIACESGNTEVVESLLKAQADANLQEIHGRSPLFAASLFDEGQVVASLVKAQADVNLADLQGYSPLHIASHNGHRQVVDALVRAQASVNAQDDDGNSPLHVAAREGQLSVVDSLLKAQADSDIKGTDGQTALQMALQNGHHSVARLLLSPQPLWLSEDPCFPAATAKDAQVAAPDDQALGRQLHAALHQSGFSAPRAAMQAALADALQTLMRKRLRDKGVFVVGSFSEGWGNSLRTLDGRTDAESDIDVMRLIRGRLYHVSGACHCGCEDAVEYDNGHILCGGFASTPAQPMGGCDLRPAVDDVAACRLCCYPPIGPLLPPRVSESNIPQHVLRALQHELASSPCHVVHAAPPGQAGKQLRVSTTFLERRLLRSLSTLQGQLFVTLKYLVKKVIGHETGFNLQGLKAYHMKSITFRMLEETPSEQWQPENLVSLLRRSLQMLLDNVERNCVPGNALGRIMEHFFLSGADLYLKGVDRSEASDMAGTLRRTATTLQSVIDQLPRLLVAFKDSLAPVSESGAFYFHPFLILPFLDLMPVRNSGSLEYHEIYDAVRESLLHLASGGCCPESRESAMRLVSRLPDCVSSARWALTALFYLKFGDPDAAAKAVRPRFAGRRPVRASRDVACPGEMPVNEEFVLSQLSGSDSAWRFCFEFYQPPALPGLPMALADLFPLQLPEVSVFHFYVNFDALLQALRLQLLPARHSAVSDWLRALSLRQDVDEQELAVADWAERAVSSP